MPFLVQPFAVVSMTTVTGCLPLYRSGYILGSLTVVSNNNQYRFIFNRERLVYKAPVCQHNLADLMENPFPTDLREYCKYFAISLFDLSLQCIFCKCYVDIVDLARFYKKQLHVVWKKNVGYVCCTKCLFTSAKYEAERHFQCAVKVADLPGLLNRPLQEIYMRCYYCLAALDLQEKFDLISRDRYACLIRGYWRGPCRDCINKD